MKAEPLPAIKNNLSSPDRKTVHPPVAPAKDIQIKAEQKKKATRGGYHRKNWNGSESELLIAIRANGSSWASIAHKYFPHWTEGGLMTKFKRLTAKHPELAARFEELVKIKHSEELETIITQTWSRVTTRREPQGRSQQQHKAQERSQDEQHEQGREHAVLKKKTGELGERKPEIGGSIRDVDKSRGLDIAKPAPVDNSSSDSDWVGRINEMTARKHEARAPGKDLARKGPKKMDDRDDAKGK